MDIRATVQYKIAEWADDDALNFSFFDFFTVLFESSLKKGTLNESNFSFFDFFTVLPMIVSAGDSDI